MELTVTENLRVGRCDVGRPRAVPRARAAPRPAGRPAVRRAAARCWRWRGPGAGLEAAARRRALPRAGAAHRRPPAPGRAVRGRRGDRRAPRRAARPQGHGGRRPDRRTAPRGHRTGGHRRRAARPARRHPGRVPATRSRRSRSMTTRRSGLACSPCSAPSAAACSNGSVSDASSDPGVPDEPEPRSVATTTVPEAVDCPGEPLRFTSIAALTGGPTGGNNASRARIGAGAALASINRECALGRPIEVSICDDGFDVNGNLAVQAASGRGRIAARSSARSAPSTTAPPPPGFPASSCGAPPPTSSPMRTPTPRSAASPSAWGACRLRIAGRRGLRAGPARQPRPAVRRGAGRGAVRSSTSSWRRSTSRSARPTTPRSPPRSRSGSRMPSGCSRSRHRDDQRPRRRGDHAREPHHVHRLDRDDPGGHR